MTKTTTASTSTTTPTTTKKTKTTNTAHPPPTDGRGELNLPRVHDDQVSVQIGGSSYLSMLRALDASFEYFSTPTTPSGGGGLNHYDGPRYRAQAEFLHGTSCKLLKQAFVDRVENTRRQIIEGQAAYAGVGSPDDDADKLEAGIIYTKFHGISSRSAGLFWSIRRRAIKFDSTPGRRFAFDYWSLLSSCKMSYCDCRLSLLRPVVARHVRALEGRHGIVGMTRVASVFLGRLCRNETQVSDQHVMSAKS